MSLFRSTDLTSQLLSLLVEFVYQLVCSGQLYLAKLLRNKFVEKVTSTRSPRCMDFWAKWIMAAAAAAAAVLVAAVWAESVAGWGVW